MNWIYKGFQCEFKTISYNCPSLKLYGYAIDTQLHAAIRREIKRRAERAAHWARTELESQYRY